MSATGMTWFRAPGTSVWTAGKDLRVKAGEFTGLYSFSESRAVAAAAREVLMDPAEKAGTS